MNQLSGNKFKPDREPVDYGPAKVTAAIVLRLIYESFGECRTAEEVREVRDKWHAAVGLRPGAVGKDGKGQSYGEWIQDSETHLKEINTW